MTASPRCRADSPVAYVDMAGNSALREKLHRHFGAQMKYSGRVGLTHRSTSPDEGELPGAKPTWFFAPDQIRKRAKEWGPGGVEHALWRGVVDLRAEPRPLAQSHRKPRAGGGEAGLSRYPERPCSARSRGTSSRLRHSRLLSTPFLGRPEWV